jgi:hypothetical protein
MTTNKTLPTNASVDNFVAAVPDAQKRTDALEILHMMERVTGKPAVLWGPSIIGFGSYHYKYESGHEGDMCILGFSPRKNATVIYLPNGAENYHTDIARLGKVKTSKACVYIAKLSNIDCKYLEVLLQKVYKDICKQYTMAQQFS